MTDTSTPSVNSWLEDELFQQYQHDRRDVDPSWGSVFAATPHESATDRGASRSPVPGDAGRPASTASVTVEMTPQPRALEAPRTPNWPSAKAIN